MLKNSQGIRVVFRSTAIALAIAGVAAVVVASLDYLRERQAVEAKEQMIIAAERVRRCR